MFFDKKKRTKSSIESSPIRKLTSLKKDGNLDEKTILTVNEIIRGYLKSKFKLPLSLTYEEVMKNLQEKKINKMAKIDLSHLLIQVYGKEYFPHNLVDQKEISFLIDLSIKTLKEIQLNKEIKEKTTVKEKPLVKDELPTIKLEKSKEMLKLEKDISSINESTVIDWKDPKIRKTYENIRNDYSKLKDEEKLETYPKIIALFNLKKS